MLQSLTTTLVLWITTTLVLNFFNVNIAVNNYSIIIILKFNVIANNYGINLKKLLNMTLLTCRGVTDPSRAKY